MPLGQEDLDSKIIIRNYPLSFTERDLRIMFEKYGTVDDLFSPKGKESNQPRGFTFCQYRRKEDAVSAINGMDGREIQGLKLSVEKCRIPRPDRSIRPPRSNRGRERRRSRSPAQRRDRSRSRERGRDNRPRSRDRGFGGREGYRGGRSPPSFEPPFYEYQQHPPHGGPMPSARARGGLLDPPFPMLGSDRGGQLGPPPPRGMREELPRRDPYGPPPSRGGFSGSHGPSSSNYGPPSPGRKAPFEDPYFYERRSEGSSGYSSQDYSRPPLDPPPPSGGRDYSYDSYSNTGSQSRDPGYSSYSSNGGGYNSSSAPRSSYTANQSKPDYNSSFYDQPRPQSSYETSSSRQSDHYSDRPTGGGYNSGSPTSRGYDSLGYGSSRGLGGGNGGFGGSPSVGRGGPRAGGYSGGRGEGFAGSPTNPPKVGYSSAFSSTQRPSTQGYPGQEYKPGSRY